MIEEVQRGEQVERDLDRLISRRAEGTGHANAAAALERAQAESRARRYREAVLFQKLDHHRAMLDAHTRTFSRLLERHKGALRLCEEALGIDTTTEGDAA